MTTLGVGIFPFRYVNHDANNILGRTSAGTLRREATDKGLKCDCDLPNTTAGLDTYESIQRGDINGCSFAFNLDEDDQQWSKEGRSVVPTIRDFKSLLDVSVFTYPAYPNTSVDARNPISAECRSCVAQITAHDEKKFAGTNYSDANFEECKAG